jgi:hypothetical protein
MITSVPRLSRKTGEQQEGKNLTKVAKPIRAQPTFKLCP